MDHKLLDFTPLGTPPSEKFQPPIPDEDLLEEGVPFYMNPFYDKVFMLSFDMRLRTYQSEGEGQKEYKRVVKQMIEEVQRDDRFPYGQGLLVVLHFSAPYEQMVQLDVDNMAKLFIDMMKGVIMTDDNRVLMLWVDKRVHATTGCKVGIKLLGVGPIQNLMPPLHLEEGKFRDLLAAQGLSLDEMQAEHARPEERGER